VASRKEGVAGTSWEVFSSVKLGVGRGSVADMGETVGEEVAIVEGVEGVSVGEVEKEGGGISFWRELRLNMPNEVSLKGVNDGGATSLVPWCSSSSDSLAGFT
jgi:hypothetical protein